MKRSFHLFAIILLSLFICRFTFAQTPEESLFKKVSVKTGLGFEFFNRSIDTFTLNSDNNTWDKDEDSFNLKSYFFTLTAEFEIQEGLFAAAILGYAFSELDSIVFRKLPFSVELETGQIGGLLFGGEIRKSLFYIRNFETELIGQFIYYMGTEQEWEIPGLVVEGTVEGTPSWMRASIGPVFTYRAYDYFFPYFYVNFNKLWGKYKMDQIVEDLKGSEDKKISAKSVISISLGAIYALTDSFSIKGEASFMPYKGGVDLGVLFKTMYVF
ncbi:MAG: hypothetical protein JSV96_07075 [Candidatus Aminicenantes bacterium]|nr:MAG: hypothetical protein JSV96_07075 [Candidatus Aminicenantes bacterium]